MWISEPHQPGLAIFHSLPVRISIMATNHGNQSFYAPVPRDVTQATDGEEKLGRAEHGRDADVDGGARPEADLDGRALRLPAAAQPVLDGVVKGHRVGVLDRIGEVPLQIEHEKIDALSFRFLCWWM